MFFGNPRMIAIEVIRAEPMSNDIILRQRARMSSRGKGCASEVAERAHAADFLCHSPRRISFVNSCPSRELCRSAGRPARRFPPRLSLEIFQAGVGHRGRSAALAQDIYSYVCDRPTGGPCLTIIRPSNDLMRRGLEIIR